MILVYINGEIRTGKTATAEALKLWYSTQNLDARIFDEGKMGSPRDTIQFPPEADVLIFVGTEKAWGWYKAAQDIWDNAEKLRIQCYRDLDS